MTEGVHYKIDFTTFARLFGFSKDDREANVIHFEAHMNHSKIASAYEYDELTDGSYCFEVSVLCAQQHVQRDHLP
jgi:hypothetical protein